MPGVHNMQVVSATGLEEPSVVTRNLAYAFLQFCGVPFRGRPVPAVSSAQGMAELYASMNLKSGEFKAHQTSGTGSRAVGGGLRRRSFQTKKHMGEYVSGGKKGYWVNEHHRECFKAAYPQLYNYIFQAGGFGHLKTLRQVDPQFGQRARTRPNDPVLQSLLAAGLVEPAPGQGDYWALPGSGAYGLAALNNLWPAGLPLSP